MQCLMSVQMVTEEYGMLHSAIEAELLANNLAVVPAFIEKIIQLHETLKARHGVMLVGAAGSGKTTSYLTLAHALSQLKRRGMRGFEEVKVYTINPKVTMLCCDASIDAAVLQAVTISELYGHFNEHSHEWSEGLIASAIRKVIQEEGKCKHWIVFDGPVDPLWCVSLCNTWSVHSTAGLRI
jgi:dynein heavy chain